MRFNLNTNFQKVYRFCTLSLFNLILILALGLIIVCPKATALLRQHHETPNVLRYHAQDSLQDSDGNTWQVILFPDNIDRSETTYYLRLVGFPGIKSFVHPQPLEIITNQGDVLSAVDAYAESAPAANVGQYDLTAIISELTTKNSLKLAVIMRGKQELALKIPSEVVTEWKLLTKEIEN